MIFVILVQFHRTSTFQSIVYLNIYQFVISSQYNPIDFVLQAA